MKKINLNELEKGKSLNQEIFRSKNGFFTLYNVVFMKGEGFSPHSHPYGEDCAFVIEGELNYSISNSERITVYENETVFGWKNMIHGYNNPIDLPLHLLIFVTPNKIGLEYLDDQDPAIIHIKREERRLHPEEECKRISEFSSFQYITIDGVYTESVSTDQLLILIDLEEKDVYIYESGNAFFKTDRPKRFLQYTLI